MDRYPPISSYALLSDCQSAALLGTNGSIDWCCFHRVDSRPVFSRLLDWDRGGYFRIFPTTPAEVTRRYVPKTNVVETTFTTAHGTVVLTDGFPLVRPGEPRHPLHQLVRVAHCTKGHVRLRLEIVPRFDYGQTIPRVEVRNENRALVYGGADGLALFSEIPLYEMGPNVAGGQGLLKEGDTAVVALGYDYPKHVGASWPTRHAKEELQDTINWWQEWSGICQYEGPYKEQVLRSALVLKALTHAPTGAIVAAATTSLPESIGGVRNWDYRYAWLRDASLNLDALFSLGYTTEAHDFMAWLRRTSAGRAADLQPLYGVAGERFVAEHTIENLEGWRQSAPVRVGNDAAKQLQLDIYGELLDTAWLYYQYGGAIDAPFWDFLRSCVDQVQASWEHPDEGIWEPRDTRRHFISSKIFCWVAVDRGIRLAQALGVAAPIEEWEALALRIRSAIDHWGTNEETGGFRRALDDTDADAANLLAPLVGFVEPSDPRVAATVKDVVERLGRPGGVMIRYKAPDGLPGEEGAFLICSFWLVDNLCLLGRIEEATTLFEQLLSYANDLGLYSEQVDPTTGELLGNFPQAFSHVGLIGSAINLARATKAAATTDGATN